MAYKRPYDSDQPFNMNLAILYRLDRLLNAVVDGLMAIDYNVTYQALKGIFREISFKLNKDEFEQINAHITTLQPMMTEFISAKSRNLKPNNIGKLSNELENFDVTLRKLLHEHNFLVRKSEDPRKALF